jgi:DNA-binding protein HU-beta
MNKTDLVNIVTQNTNLAKKDVELVVNSVLETIKTSIYKGLKIKLSGFGNFEAVDREERTGTNPKTHEKMIIPAAKALKFKASQVIKRELKLL